MSAFDEKWRVIPQAEPMTKKRVLELIEQAKWNSYVNQYLPRIIDNYNKQHPDDPIKENGDV